MAHKVDTCMSANPPLPLEFSRYNQLGLSGFTHVAITAALEYTCGRVGGDYYEFGLYAGSSFYHAQQEARRLDLSAMNFWGFDSFQGLPAVTAKPDIGRFVPGLYTCSLETVRLLHNCFGVDWRRTHLIKGWYEDTLNATLVKERGMAPAAVVVVDCDLYTSTVPVLRFIAPLLQPRTVIIFDDWHQGGEQQAFREWLPRYPQWGAKEYRVKDMDYHQKMFIMYEAEAGAEVRSRNARTL